MLFRSDCDASSVGADQILTGGMSANGEALQWLAPKGGTSQFTTVDPANGNGGPWPAGAVSPNHNSMERRGSAGGRPLTGARPFSRFAALPFPSSSVGRAGDC